jgi:hypothetical protein
MMYGTVVGHQAVRKHRKSRIRLAESGCLELPPTIAEDVELGLVPGLRLFRNGECFNDCALILVLLRIILDLLGRPVHRRA